MTLYLGKAPPPPADTHRRPRLVTLRGGASSTLPYLGYAHDASDCFLSAHSVGASLSRADTATPPPSTRLRRLLPSPTSATRWYISWEGFCHASLNQQRSCCLQSSPPEHPMGMFPGLPSSTRLRRLRSSPTGNLVGLSPGRRLCHASFPRHACAASGRLLPAQLFGASTRRGPYHASVHRHAYAATGHLLPAHPVGASPGRATCHVSLHRYVHAASDCLLLVPGAPGWYMSGGVGGGVVNC